MAFELTQAQFEKLNIFTSTTVVDNPKWDEVVQRLRVLVDTPLGRKFVSTALAALTVQLEEDDLHQNCEMLAATIALKLVDDSSFITAMTSQFPRLKNKAAITELLLLVVNFNEEEVNFNYLHVPTASLLRTHLIQNSA